MVMEETLQAANALTLLMPLEMNPKSGQPSTVFPAIATIALLKK